MAPPRTKQPNPQDNGVAETPQIAKPVEIAAEEAQLVLLLLSNAQVCSLFTDPDSKVVSANLHQKLARLGR